MKHECQNAAPDCTNGHPQDRSIVGIREICAPCYHKSSRKPLKKGRAMFDWQSTIPDVQNHPPDDKEVHGARLTCLKNGGPPTI